MVNPYVPNTNLRSNQLNQIPTADIYSRFGNQMQNPAQIQVPQTPQAEGGGFNTMGAIQAGTALLGAGMNTYNMANQSLNLPEMGQAYQVSATGKPVYAQGQDYINTMNAKPQGATAGEVGSQALSLASAGMAFGPVGAAAGAVIGAGAALFGGNRRRKKQEEEKRRAQRKLRLGQEAFNQASQSFDEQVASNQEYQRRRDMTNRLYNLYSLPQTTAY
jgi:hypothetical protein